MRRRVLVWMLAVIGLIGLFRAAQAYTTYGKWTVNPVLFYVNPATADVGASAVETALAAAMDIWNTQAGTPMRFQYAGRVTDTTTGYDSRNVIIFRNSTNGSTIASTYSWSSNGALVDSDIIFWDGGFRFFTGTSGCGGSNAAYIEDIGAHELGHALGLNHSAATDATMYPSYSTCSQSQRTLAADDIAGARALYSASAPPPSNTAPTIAIVTPITGTSVPYGTAIAFSGSASDTQDGDISSRLTWRSSVDSQIGTGGAFSRALSTGTHVITASVTDTGGLSSSRQVTVTVLAPTGVAPTLSARGYIGKKSRRYADLSWSGLTGTTVSVFRNGSAIASTANDGAHTDIMGGGVGIVSYKVCVSGTTLTCTNTVSVSF